MQYRTTACLWQAASVNRRKLKDDFEAKENEMKMAKISYEAAIDQVIDDGPINNYIIWFTSLQE